MPLLWKPMYAALDWTFSMSSNLKVKLGMKSWLEHGILTIKASRSVSYGAFNDDR